MRRNADSAKAQTLSAFDKRVLCQAARELLLAQSSDWPFIITNGTTEQYARRRFADHLNRFHDLISGFEKHAYDEERLATLEYMDAVFPELDYELYCSGAPR